MFFDNTASRTPLLLWFDVINRIYNTQNRIKKPQHEVNIRNVYNHIHRITVITKVERKILRYAWSSIAFDEISKRL